MSIPQREFEPHWNTASSGDMRTHVRATQVSPIATSVQPSTSGRVTCKFHFNLHRLTSETLGEALVPLEFAMVQTTIPVSDWIEKQLDDVAQLGPNWDGCGAVAIQPATVNAMKRELTDLLRPPYIRGTIVPGADGSLQAE